MRVGTTADTQLDTVRWHLIRHKSGQTGHYSRLCSLLRSANTPNQCPYPPRYQPRWHRHPPPGRDDELLLHALGSFHVKFSSCHLLIWVGNRQYRRESLRTRGRESYNNRVRVSELRPGGLWLASLVGHHGSSS